MILSLIAYKVVMVITIFIENIFAYLDMSLLPTKGCKKQAFARCLQRFRLERDPYRTTPAVTWVFLRGGGSLPKDHAN